MKLENKVVFITGATKGIGLSIAKACLQQKMKVLVNGRYQETVDNIVEELGADYPDKVIGFAGNVTELDKMTAAVAKIKQTWGQLDVVIANAGVGHFATVSLVW